MVSSTRSSLQPVSNNKLPTTPGTKLRKLKGELEAKETENQTLRDEVDILTKALAKVDLVKEVTPEPANDDEANTKKGKKNTAVVPAKTAYKFYCENVPKQDNMQQAWKEAAPEVREKYAALAKADKARFEQEKAAHDMEQQALEAFREKKKQDAALKFYEAHLEAQKAIGEANAAKDKKKKTIKDPDAPKRCMSSYMFFAQDMRPTVVAENPAAKMTEISKILGEKWSKVSGTKAAKKYEDMATTDRERYSVEKEEYDAKVAERKAEEAREKELAIEEEKKEAMELYATQAPTTNGAVEVDNMSVITDVSGGKATKKKKDPNAPKRGLSAYNYFMKENREPIKSKMGDKVSNADLMAEIGKQWKELSDRKKAKYEKMADKDKKRYEKEMEAYNKTKH